MPCAGCASLLEASQDDRDRRELDAGFEVVEEREDKADSATMMWTGTARCRACGQRVYFDYRHGPSKTGRVVPLP